MKIQRAFAFPSPWTFRIKPIRQVVLWYMQSHGGVWIDPFAGFCSPAHLRNDIDPAANAQTHLHARDFIEGLKEPFHGVLFDPPYSPTQVKDTYERLGTKGVAKDYQSWSDLKKKNNRKSLSPVYGNYLRLEF